MSFLPKHKLKMIILLAVAIITLITAGCDTRSPADEPAVTSAVVPEDHSAHVHAEWMTDFEAAKRKAASEGKDLLINFAGSDWCYWCKRLDKEVFNTQEFLHEAENDFVLVLIDFPNDKSGQSQQVQQQNAELAEQFGVRGFPTVFLATPDGKPYAQTGYQEGGSKAYLAHLEELKKNK